MSSENIYYWISVPILAEIENISEAKVRKVYKKVIQDECIPLRDIPVCEQEIYVKEYPFRDRMLITLYWILSKTLTTRLLYTVLKYSFRSARWKL